MHAAPRCAVAMAFPFFLVRHHPACPSAQLTYNLLAHVFAQRFLLAAPQRYPATLRQRCHMLGGQEGQEALARATGRVDKEPWTSSN